MIRVTSILLPWVAALSVLSVGLLVMPNIFDRGRGSAPPDWTSHDASPGTAVVLPTTDMFGTSINPQARTLLVFGGSCSQCSLNAVPPSRLKNAPESQVVLLYVSSERQLKETFKAPDSKVRVVADPKGALVSVLGAQSAPRFYVLDHGALE